MAAPSVLVAPPASTYFAEDVEAIELYFLSGNDFLDYSANTVKLAVGLTAPAAFQTSWTAISTGVSATITSTQTGGSGADAIQRVAFDKEPVRGTFALRLPSRNVTVSTVAAGLFTCASPHGLVNGQNVTLTGFSSITGFANGASVFVRDRTTVAFAASNTLNGTAITSAAAAAGGTATIAALTTPQLTHDANSAQVQGGLSSAVGSTQITVSGNVKEGLVLTYGGQFGGVAFSNVSVVNSNLAAADGLFANLSFNTSEIESLISAGNTSNLRLEVEVSDGTLRQTYASSANISADIIATSSPVPLPNPTPASSFNLIAPNSDVWNVTIDNSGVLTATKQ